MGEGETSTMMKKDIAYRSDIDNLVKVFYDKLLQDALISHFFVNLDLSTHLPRIADFWESVLLDSDTYRGNVTEKHIKLHYRIPIQKEHFERWLMHWKDTLNALFEGEKANTALKRATLMATLMEIKIEQLPK